MTPQPVHIRVFPSCPQEKRGVNGYRRLGQYFILGQYFRPAKIRLIRADSPYSPLFFRPAQRGRTKGRAARAICLARSLAVPNG